MVELLVAMVFVFVLMLGLSAVFKGSLSTYITSAEKSSAVRQNRLALEALFDDLNQCGLSATSLTQPPDWVTSANLPFQINPATTYNNTDVPTTATAVNGGQTVINQTDQLLLYYEGFLPYECTLSSTIYGTAVGVALKETLTTNLSGGGGNSFTLTFNDSTQPGLAAAAVTQAYNAGMGPQMATGSLGLPIASMASSSGSTATVTLASNTTSKFNIPSGAKVNLVVPNQYVCYSIKPVLLDPSQPTTYTPCLVRDLVAYPANGTTPLAVPFTNVISSSIVADNVTGFHVGLSADGGNTWAGYNTATNSWNATSWAGIIGSTTGATKPQLNYQLANLDTTASPTPSTGTSLFWFRQYPIMVRIDIQTRTLKSRPDYATVASATPTPAYNYQTRTLILNPRHFGLTY